MRHNRNICWWSQFLTVLLQHVGKVLISPYDRQQNMYGKAMLLCRNKCMDSREKLNFHCKVRKTKTMLLLHLANQPPRSETPHCKTFFPPHTPPFLYFLAWRVIVSTFLSTNGLKANLPFCKLQEKIIKYLSSLTSRMINKEDAFFNWIPQIPDWLLTA